MIYAQYFILLLTVIKFLDGLYYCFNDRPAKREEGFEGAIVSVIALIISLAIYHFAGAFSQIF